MSGRPKLTQVASFNKRAEQLLHVYETRDVTIHVLGRIFGMTYSSANRCLVRARKIRAEQKAKMDEFRRVNL